MTHQIAINAGVLLAQYLRVFGIGGTTLETVQQQQAQADHIVAYLCTITFKTGHPHLGKHFFAGVARLPASGAGQSFRSQPLVGAGFLIQGAGLMADSHSTRSSKRAASKFTLVRVVNIA